MVVAGSFGDAAGSFGSNIRVGMQLNSPEIMLHHDAGGADSTADLFRIALAGLIHSFASPYFQTLDMTLRNLSLL